MASERKDERGFTLLEVLAAVVLLALFSSVVSVALVHTDYLASFDSVKSILSHVDGTLRHEAQASGRVAILRIALTERTLTVEGKAEVLRLRLPRGISLRDVRVLHASVQEEEVISIECSPDGVTPSYSLCFGDREGGGKCFLVAGLTGQLTEDNDHELHTKLFQGLKGPQPR